MQRWQNGSSSSSPSSSSSSPSQLHLDDSVLDRGARKSDMASFFSFHGRARERGFASQARRLTRARKLRHLTDNEVYVSVPDLEPNEIWLSPRGGGDTSSSSSARSPAASTPQPLPLPDLNLLLRREAGLASKIPLPSPRNGDDNGDGVTLNAGIASRLSQDVRRNAEHSESHTSKKSGREPNGHYLSAPASPFASPALSPRPLPGDMVISSYMLPQSNPIWTPQDFPAPEKKAISVDNSPLHSPRGSSQQSIRSYAAGSSSPLPNRLSVDNPIQRRESNAQANVHPLPLPPGAAVPPQTPQVASKPELMQVKGKWQKGKLIGRGTFGSVYVASNRETGALCAMKEVELLPDDPQSAECIRQLQQEIKVLSQLKHQNIVQYYGSEIVDDRFFIYLEYVHPGSINKYIRDHGGAMTESVVRNFTRHILSGLAYLHSTKTIHRDIKGANLLVDAYGVVKLADFGMAKHLTGQVAQLSLKGSPYWMAPELLQCVMQDDNNPDVALAVDIWSLGCTIVEMMNGKPPWSEFEGPAAMFKVLKETPPIPDSMSADGKDFLRCCFRRNPAERPTAGMLLEHRFLKNVQQLDVLSSANALHGMNLSEKPRTQRERPSYKLELPGSVMNAQSTRRKVENTFIYGPFSPASLTNDLRT